MSAEDRSRHLVGRTAGYAPADLHSRPPDPSDAEALAVLMLDAYQGTVDADGSETIGTARGEVSGYFGGESGPPLLDVSRVIESGDRLVAAVLVSHYEELPLIAYVMTAASHKRRGLASGLLGEVLGALDAVGEPRAHLWVTATNPAVRLYATLGFVDVPQAPDA